MAVKGFDVFDQMIAAAVVTGTTPRTQTAPQTAPAPTAQGRSLIDKLADSLLFNASVVLGVFAGIVYALGTILWDTPLGRVLPFENFGMWLAVILGALSVAGAMTAVLVATVQRVTA